MALLPVKGLITFLTSGGGGGGGVVGNLLLIHLIVNACILTTNRTIRVFSPFIQNCQFQYILLFK